jgi:dihydroorotase
VSLALPKRVPAARGLGARGTIIRGARVIDPRAGLDTVTDVLVLPASGDDEECIILDPAEGPPGARVVDGRGLWALPGLVDLQVHFREPGQTHKEDLGSGSRAAVAGGVTTVVVMPNTRPVLDDPALVRAQSAIAAARGLARVLVAAAATKGSLGKEISDYASLKDAGAIAVTDDGLPVLDDDVMHKALVSCRKNDLLFMQHAEDTRITRHVPMTLSAVSAAAGVEGQPSDAEGSIVERDIALATKTGARYHVLHLSTARSLRAVRAAKAAGARVSCEVSPHHLLLTYDDVVRGRETPRSANDLDPNKKMNPPLRSEDDRRALVAGLADGTVDAVATDHAPHASDEKGQGFVKAPFGVTGLETMLAALLTFVHDGTIDVGRAVELMTAGPARVLHRSVGLGTLAGVRAPADLCLVDPVRLWNVSEGSVLSRSKNSCFLGRRFQGRVVMTFLRGHRVFELVPGLASAAHASPSGLDDGGL